jgi:hypothetical protein
MKPTVGYVTTEPLGSNEDFETKILKRIESQKEWEEKLLGILAMHAEMFGRRSLHDLLIRGRILAKSS